MQGIGNREQGIGYRVRWYQNELRCVYRLRTLERIADGVPGPVFDPVPDANHRRPLPARAGLASYNSESGARPRTGAPE